MNDKRFQQEFVKKAVELENAVIAKAIEEYLAHPPTPLEMKNVSASYHKAVDHKYILKYKGRELGEITKGFQSGLQPKFTVNFKPFF